MGSKTYEDSGPHQDYVNTSPSLPAKEGKPRGAQLDETGAGDGDNDEDDGDGDHDAHEKNVNHATNDTGKKKRKKRNKKKAKSSAPTEQSSPPRVPLSSLFPSDTYPLGELQENLARTTEGERRHLSHLHKHDEQWLNTYRRAAEVHRQVRSWVQSPGVIVPGKTTLTELAVGIEDSVHALLGSPSPLEAGMGFPTGLSLNHCAAHFTPNRGFRDIVVQNDDVLKVDFGVHIGGWIVDSAFTLSWTDRYDPLLTAVREATNTGIHHSGVDARMGEIGAEIQEVMESYEVVLDGKTYPIKAVRNINGHNIAQYRIHGGKSVPFIKSFDQTKMEEGEVFAIETFGTTGKGRMDDDWSMGTYGYGKSYDAPANPNLRLASARGLLKTINENFSTLVWSRRQLEKLGVQKYLLGLNALVNAGVVDTYAPLVDVKGSYTAQFEHTIIIGENGKEVISRGEDY